MSLADLFDVQPDDVGELLSLEDLLGRPSWHQLAACRGMGPHLFFPSRGEPTAEAREICAGCVVRSDCLTEAMSESDVLQGVWAGTSQRQRREARKERGYGTVELLPCRHCGTEVPKLSAMRFCPPCEHYAAAYGALRPLERRSVA